MQIIRNNTKNCIKCSILLCEKNEYLVFDKKYVRYHRANSCKSCATKANYCKLKYPSEELELLSKKRCQQISKNKWKIYNKEKVKEYKSKQKQEQKESVKKLDDYYVKVLLSRLSNHHINLDDVPEKLIELKKKELIIKRELKNQGIWVR
jgi:hypothetical protein